MRALSGYCKPCPWCHWRATASRVLCVSVYSDTRVRVRKCVSGDNFRRNSVSHRAEFVVDVGGGSLLGHDRLRACSLARTRDPWRNGALLRHTWPRRFVSPLWVGRSLDEVATAGLLEAASLVSPSTPIREYGSENAIRATTLDEIVCPIAPNSS